MTSSIPYRGFFILLPLLHATGAILATVISFVCDTGRAKQNALIPYRISAPRLTYSPELQFRAAYPWAEDETLDGNEWNPFALIFVFEWLTAAFALKPLADFMSYPARLFYVWVIWLLVGLAVFITWTATNSGGPCVFMIVAVIASFVACGIVGYYRLFVEEAQGYTQVPTAVEPPSTRTTKEMDPSGRVWILPSSVSKLRQRRLGDDQAAPMTVEDALQYVRSESVIGVIWRYIEYCITAPLLFLAVVCLMVTDPPAWLFITGYWLILICNILGIALHASFTANEFAPPNLATTTLAGTIKILFSFPW